MTTPADNPHDRPQTGEDDAPHGDDPAATGDPSPAEPGASTPDHEAESTAEGQEGTATADVPETGLRKPGEPSCDHDPIVFPPGWEPGAPLPDDWVDQELAGDDPLGNRVDFGRPMLVFLVAAFAIWLAAQYTLELRYAFTPGEPIDLGRAEELRLDPEVAQDGQLVLPSNRYVRLEAILERRAVADTNTFFKIVGVPIILQQIDERPEDDARLFRDLPRSPQRGEATNQPMSTVPGRLVAFDSLPQRYRSVAGYYSEALATHYCGVEPSLELQRYLENRRETTRLRLTSDLQREPTEEELDARMGRHARCQQGYMFFAEQSPRDFWYFPLLYLFFLVLLLGSLFNLIGWGRETFGARD